MALHDSPYRSASPDEPTEFQPRYCRDCGFEMGACLCVSNHRTPETRQLAEDYCGELCTLDGEPARIVGRAERFATVLHHPQRGLHVQYAWETVHHVMSTQGGAFKS